jgi:hypothetical protein
MLLLVERSVSLPPEEPVELEVVEISRSSKLLLNKQINTPIPISDSGWYLKFKNLIEESHTFVLLYKIYKFCELWSCIVS